MGIRNIIILLICCYSLAIGVAVAQQEIPDVIMFEAASKDGGPDEVYRSLYSGQVEFTHAKHVNAYGAVCGDCHHDENHNAITGHTEGDIYSCRECHPKKGLIRGVAAENAASEEDLVERRGNTMHTLCIGCHKQYNELARVVLVREACITCHDKLPPDWVTK